MLQPLYRTKFTHQGQVKSILIFVSHCDSAAHQIWDFMKKVAKQWQKIQISMCRLLREQML